ncbi:MAG: hypothetical protein NTU95_12355 [Methanothrix sp.]|nr:hypothetical protein [Methanothrix sp.]
MDEKTKTKLSDVLGAFVTSVAYGRNVSDVQALRIALNYQKNVLLQGLPVPRLRLSQVSISLPVILTKVLPGEPPRWNSPEEITKVASTSFQTEIEDELKRLDYLERLKNPIKEEKDLYERYKRFLLFSKDPEEYIKKTDTPESQKYKKEIAEEEITSAYESFEKVLRSRLNRAFLKLEMDDSSNIDVAIRYTVGETVESAFRDVMSEFFFRYAEYRIKVEKIEPNKEMENEGSEIESEKSNQMAADIRPKFDEKMARKGSEKIMESEITERMIADIRPLVEKAAIDKPSIPPDFYIEVDTDSIKNAGGGPDAVTRLSIVMHEEGLEWLSEEREGLKTKRLMPE